eukprot:RCo031167
MAVGKNKRLGKGGKKAGLKRKAQDMMTRKEWYDVVAPAWFTKRVFAKTLVNKTVGMKLSSDSLRGRVFEISLGDLNEDESQAYRKFRLRVEEIQGRVCLTNFHGMLMTTDKYRSLLRKWCSTIQMSTVVKTTDGYSMRVFVVGFTKRRANHVKKNCYASPIQKRRLRQKIVEIVRDHVTKGDLPSVVQKFQHETIGKDIERASNPIYPLRDVFVKKVKLIRRPKYDLNRLMELHGNAIPECQEDLGQRVLGEPVAAAAPAAAVEEDKE